MRRIAAIAGVAVRGAIRSRVVLTLLCLLCVLTVLMPSTIEGDGTLSGYMRVLLSYTLTAVRLLLAVVSLWAGCAAISMEVEDRQIQMALSKPLHTWQIWLGKWCGLAFMNALFIIFAGLLIALHLIWATRPARLTAAEQQHLREEVMVSRLSLKPVIPEAKEQINQALERVLPEGAEASDEKRRQLRRALRSQWLRARFAARPESRMTANFRIPVHAGGPFYLDYRMASSSVSSPMLAGEWVLKAGGQELWRHTLQHKPQRRHSLRIPLEGLRGGQELQLVYVNREEDVTVFFNPDDGLELLAPVGSFWGNYVRTWMVEWAFLAFISAIGVSMGSLFSMPVAAFVSVFALMLTQLDQYIHDMAGEQNYFLIKDQMNAVMAVMNRIFHAVFSALDILVAPLQHPGTLEALSTGRLVPGALVARIMGTQVLAYGVVLMLISAVLLKRREVAKAG